MWKDTTVRKILPPRLSKAEARWRLPTGIATFALALISGYFGFGEGAPSLAGLAKGLCFLFGAAALVLSALGYRAGRKSP